eukprot:scaffold113081_cov54-Phaeocystis_antarctica.AAC.1
MVHNSPGAHSLPGAERCRSTLRHWTQKHRYELERRLQQERCRGLMRVVVRAWLEEADGRKARSLR